MERVQLRARARAPLPGHPRAQPRARGDHDGRLPGARPPGRVLARAQRARAARAARCSSLVILPFWTSFLVRMYAWIFLLRTEGLVNVALAGAGPAGAEPPLQRLRGAAGPGLRRAAVHDPAALRLAREARPLAARGRRRPGRHARARAAARHAAAHPSGHRRRLRAGVRAVARRLPGAGPAGRRAHGLRRQPHPEPVRGRARHAVRRGALVRAVACSCSRCCSPSAARSRAAQEA